GPEGAAVPAGRREHERQGAVPVARGRFDLHGAQSCCDLITHLVLRMGASAKAEDRGLKVEDRGKTDPQRGSAFPPRSSFLNPRSSIFGSSGGRSAPRGEQLIV